MHHWALPIRYCCANFSLSICCYRPVVDAMLRIAGNGLPRQCAHWLAMTMGFDTLRINLDAVSHQIFMSLRGAKRRGNPRPPHPKDAVASIRRQEDADPSTRLRLAQDDMQLSNCTININLSFVGEGLDPPTRNISAPNINLTIRKRKTPPGGGVFYQSSSGPTGRTAYIFFFHLPVENTATDMIMPSTQESIREPNSATGLPWGNSSLRVR